jgi:GNAT superfamily N-acetyltransferase
VIITSEQSYDVVATCSVKDFGDGDIETYAQWSKNLSGAQWVNRRTATVDKVTENNPPKFELTAFAVSPHHQAMGLGARLLNEVKWLLAGRKFHSIAADTAPTVHGLGLSDAMCTSWVNGIDLDQLKQVMEIQRPDNISQRIVSPKLVLMAIRELGNELYYQKRGFKTVWSGTVPVGMWDCLTECTMVYMEMLLD